MRVMKNRPLAWILSVGLLMGLVLPSEPGQAEQKSKESAKPMAQTMESGIHLSDIRSFGVYDLEPTDFSPNRDAVPQELVEYARAALQKDERFHYDSPAQGLLRFRCDNGSCNRIRAEVTYGESGPVIWQTVQQFRRCPFVEFRFMPDAKKFSDQVVQQLAQDYAKSVKAVPGKIQIQED